MTLSIHRIGIRTGGGACPHLNTVIRAVVKTAPTVAGSRSVFWAGTRACFCP